MKALEAETEGAVKTDPFGISASAEYIWSIAEVLRFEERAKWNDEGKEKVFKQQFVDHVTKKRQQIFDSISPNCSKQVKQ